MSSGPGFRVYAADWRRESEAIRTVRTQVFVEEQGVPPEIEEDGEDGRCAHVLAVDEDSVPVGTGRMLPDGHIGRLAVMSSMRGRGVGAALLQALIELAQSRGMHEVFLHAQVQAIPFYTRHGFEAQGGIFYEGGIAHRAMMLRLATVR